MTSVIIIDDDHDFAESIAELLNLHNIEVLDIGHNGQDAVKLFQKCKPDCVILDYNMPEYDGLYGLKEIRKISPFCKVVIVSGAINYSMRCQFLSNGADRVLEKPFNVNELCEIIQENEQCVNKV